MQLPREFPKHLAKKIERELIAIFYRGNHFLRSCNIQNVWCALRGQPLESKTKIQNVSWRFHNKCFKTFFLLLQSQFALRLKFLWCLTMSMTM